MCELTGTFLPALSSTFMTLMADMDPAELPFWNEIHRLEARAAELRDHIQSMRVVRWQQEVVDRRLQRGQPVPATFLHTTL